MNIDGSKSYTGSCPFCHQTVIYSSYEKVDDADAEAWKACKCEKATRRQNSDRAHRSVDSVCCEKARANGFVVLSEEQVNQVKTACDQLLDGELQTASFRFSHDDEIKLKVKIAADRSYVIVTRRRTLMLEAM